jgi:hypothetical protein
MTGINNVVQSIMANLYRPDMEVNIFMVEQELDAALLLDNVLLILNQ